MKNRKFLFLVLLVIFIIACVFYFSGKKNSYSDVVEYSGIIDSVNQKTIVLRGENHPLDKDVEKQKKEFNINSRVNVFKSSATLKTQKEYEQEVADFNLKKKNGELVFEFPSKYKNDKISIDDIEKYLNYYVVVFYSKSNDKVLEIFIDNNSEETIDTLDMGDDNLLLLRGSISEKNNDSFVVIDKKKDIMTNKESIKKYDIDLDNLGSLFILNKEKPESCFNSDSCPMKDGLYIHKTNFNSIKNGDSVLLFYKNINSKLFVVEMYVYR